MFCPQCGNEQIADEVRYCPRCGLELGVVRAYLAGAFSPAVAQQSATTTAPRQRNINLGIVSMLLGTMLTGLIVSFIHVKVEGAGIILLLCYLLLMLFARPIARTFARLTSAEEAQHGAPAAQHREFNYGATFMLIGTLLATCAAIAAPGQAGTPVFFAVLFINLFLLLLSSHRIMRATQVLLADDEEQTRMTASMRRLQADITASTHALPPAQSVPVSIFTAQRATTAEMVAPPSITERTTSLLQDE